MNTADSDPKPKGFDANVFVNCPFDQEYTGLLRALLFTILYLDYRPRIASERSDSGENRIDKICELIHASRYSIHDLSRLKASRPDEFFRMNMPFEMGLDFGARRFGPGFLQQKRSLVLEAGAFDYKVALSDVSGVDIKSHQGRPDEVVRCVRDWFLETIGVAVADYPKVIWSSFNDFTTDLFEQRIGEGLAEQDVAEDIARMPVTEYIECVFIWLEQRSMP